MTDKQEKILEAALQLFANEGFNATPTIKVAKCACVSEGLIFRHFKNKEGLVKAILQQGADKMKVLVEDIISEKDPKLLIRKSLNMVNTINKDDFDFWKLQFKLKWELELTGEEKIEPLKSALIGAFEKLGYENAKHEAEFILLINEGLASQVLKGISIDTTALTQLALSKYRL